MRISELHWLDHIVDKIELKHHVAPKEVEELIKGIPHVRRGEQGTYRAYGQTYGGRYLFVVFVLESTSIARIITARDMTEAERKLYKKSRKN